ncbi:uncharacterized protein LOC142980577 [Anticarsia gemmatalis]|uniref:uncharacterized protein LOC142980577 n=1 Tax=Anticarsia gemmatalis TaxID=129554 RepID=UPI003F75C232
MQKIHSMDKNLLATIQTKERSANFTKEEMDRLQCLLSKYKHILFCKKTDGISTKQKESAWNLIEQEFNALGDNFRTIKQLKYKFENLKRIAKKGASKERQEMRRTGGGPLPPPLPGSEDAKDWLRSIVRTSIDGNDAVYDDDTLNQTTVLISVDEITIIEVDERAAKEKWEFDTSTPISSLKRPVSSPLRRRAKKEKIADNSNQVKQLWREKKIAIVDSLQELELKKINESISHAQELHDQMLRHNEERHQLQLEKLKLEIAILKRSAE